MEFILSQISHLVANFHPSISFASYVLLGIVLGIGIPTIRTIIRGGR